MTERLLAFFVYKHLSPELQAVSKPFSDLAHQIATALPVNQERTISLRKLIEAKDNAVRSFLIAKVEGT